MDQALAGVAPSSLRSRGWRTWVDESRPTCADLARSVCHLSGRALGSLGLSGAWTYPRWEAERPGPTNPFTLRRGDGCAACRAAVVPRRPHAGLVTPPARPGTRSVDAPGCRETARKVVGGCARHEQRRLLRCLAELCPGSPAVPGSASDAGSGVLGGDGTARRSGATQNQIPPSWWR